MSAAAPDLQKLISLLAARYGKPRPPITTDPFELILLENVAYLVSDERREEAFRMLRKHAGTKPHKLLAATHNEILTATKLGGMVPTFCCANTERNCVRRVRRCVRSAR
jgi:hypothetical protein